MKRRVTSLPPISSEVFADKVLAAQAFASSAATKASFEKTCVPCEKTYFSENAFYNHVGSAKHAKQVALVNRRNKNVEAAPSITSTIEPSVAAATIDSQSEVDTQMNDVAEKMEKTTVADEADEEAEDDKVDEKIEVPLKRCLFCNLESDSLDTNVMHMQKTHNMFIPEKQYLVDLEGLIGHLYEKINHYHECITCGKLKPSVFGLQTHMRDKAHCSIRFHTEDEQLEIGEFYDFRATYSDDEGDWSDEEDEDESATKPSAAAKLGARRTPKDADRDAEMEDGEGWETDSSASSLDSEDLTSVPMSSRQHRYEKLDQHPHHASRTDPRPHKSADGFHSHAHKHTSAAYYSDYELHLPTGRAVGHRSLAKYYRQNLHNHPSPAERQEQFMIEQARHDSDAEEERDERVVKRENRERGRALNSRANGGRGMQGVVEYKKKEVAVLEKRSRKQEHFDRQRFDWRNNKQNNSQKHFRVRISPQDYDPHQTNITPGSTSAVDDSPFGWRQSEFYSLLPAIGVGWERLHAYHEFYLGTLISRKSYDILKGSFNW